MVYDSRHNTGISSLMPLNELVMKDL